MSLPEILEAACTAAGCRLVVITRPVKSQRATRLRRAVVAALIRYTGCGYREVADLTGLAVSTIFVAKKRADSALVAEIVAALERESVARHLAEFNSIARGIL